MAILRLNFTNTGLVAPQGPQWRHALEQGWRHSDAEKPICILVHGFRYLPGARGRDPHDLIYSTRTDLPDPRHVSWPRHLGYGHENDKSGLCIAYGWPANGTIWAAHARAGQAGLGLAQVLDALAEVTANKTDFLCHSLGARVALTAARTARRPQIGRVILMAGAEHGRIAQATAAGLAADGGEFFNICSRENDPFDTMFEMSLALKGQFGRALGASLPSRPENWLDIQIDNAHARSAICALGVPLAPPVRQICHWSGYTRPGMLRLYKALFGRHSALSFDSLSRALPSKLDPRWSAFVRRAD